VTFEEIDLLIRQENADFTAKGISPLYQVGAQAKICIIGQAPGIVAQNTQLCFNDASGERLRAWLGVSSETFYHSPHIAIMPMDFYYPGKGRSGDLPPRSDFAPKWHPLLLELMPDLQLIILVGSYSVKHYLHRHRHLSLTDILRKYDAFLPAYFPLVHPSPRNNIWLKKNPWFEEDVVPVVQKLVAQILAK